VSIYKFVDSGSGQKLEQFGDVTLIRPASAALWHPTCPKHIWDAADAVFTREGGNRWIFRRTLPKQWVATVEGLNFRLSLTDFGHLGVFPEHALLWRWMVPKVRAAALQPNILNLFAYSGGATLALAASGAKVCHLDASKGMVEWARENAALNNLQEAPIRWIVDDVLKFLRREVRRGVRYEGIILDPPSFGRGKQGEVFKIEQDLLDILDLCAELLSDQPLFMVLSSHTPGMTPLVLRNLLAQRLARKGVLEEGELALVAKESCALPSGCFARWSNMV